jgi:hypothetical protein
MIRFCPEICEAVVKASAEYDSGCSCSLCLVAFCTMVLRVAAGDRDQCTAAAAV